MGSKSTIISLPLIAKTHVERINERMEKELVTLKTEIETLPKSKLYIRYRGSLVLFTERCKDKKLYGITRNRDLVHALARREYLQLHMELLEQILYEG